MFFQKILSVIAFLCLCIEITQQQLKRLLVAVVVFPARKIGHVACVANMSRPASFHFHDGLIQANWEVVLKDN